MRTLQLIQLYFYVWEIYEEELKYGNVNLDDPRLKFLYKDRLPEIINAYARKIKSSFKSHVIFINQRKKRGKKINKWDIEKYNSYFMKWINWCKKHNRKCEISEEDLKVFKQ